MRAYTSLRPCQALVSHCAVGLGRPDRVERCVLHLDVASLDLDQVGGSLFYNSLQL